MSIVLTLGNFTFQDMEVPEVMPFHAAQRLSVKKMVGGVRQIDAMGVDPGPITWSGTFFATQYGESALQRAQAIEAIRDAGQPVNLMWDSLYYSVYISDFKPDYRAGRIPYSITVEVLQNLSTPINLATQPSVDDLVGADLNSANVYTTQVGDATLTKLMATLQTAIFAASSVIAMASSVSVAITAVTSLVGAPPSVVNPILQALLAASARVGVLSSSADSVLVNVSGPGGVVAGGTTATNVAGYEAMLAANNSQNALLPLAALLGRMQSNLQAINSSARTITVSGGNLYDIAAKEYGDASGATLIMQANGLHDPTIAGNTTLIIPPYNQAAANGGILAS